MTGQRREVLDQLAAAMSQPPGLVLISGARGMGKSWLIERSLEATGASAVVVTCRGLPVGPYVVVRELVAGLTEAGAAPRRLANQVLRLLGTSDSYAVCQASRELLGGATGIVVCEDLDRADTESLQVLRYLAGRLPSDLTLVITHSLAGRPPLGARLDSASPVRVHRIDLGPLELGELAGMTNTHARLLHRLTDGIPLFVSALAGHPSLDADGVVAALAEDGVPRPVRELAEELVAGAADPVRRILATAALIGRPVAPRILAAASGTAELLVLESVDTGFLHGLSGGLVVLRPQVLALAVAETVRQVDRRVIHADIAKALENAEGAASAEVVQHWRRAGDLDGAARVAERMAESAMTKGDPGGAVEVLQGLLGEPALPQPLRAGLAARLGRLALTSLDYRQTVTLLRAILADPRVPAGLRAELRLSLALVLSNQAGEGEAGRAELVRAVKELRRRPAWAARAMSALALPQWGNTPLDEHLWWLHRAEETVPQQGDPALLTAVAVNRASTLMAVGDPRAWEAAAALPKDGSTAGERQQLLRGYSNLASGATSLGHHAAAAGFLTHADELAHRAEPSYPRHLAIATGLRLALATGRWTGLEERARRHLALAASTPYVAGDALVVLGQLAMARGDWDEASELLRSPVVQLTSGRCGAEVTMAAALRIRLAVLQGQLPAALAEAATAVEIIRNKGVWAWAAELASSAVQALLAAGEIAAARRLVDEFAADTAGRDFPFGQAVICYCHATVAAAEDLNEEAAGLFLEAAAQLAALPRPYAQARAIEAAGSCRSDTDPDAATEHVTTAAEIFATLQATWDAARCGQFLREHGGLKGGHHPGRRGYGGELSPREREVAHLIALGRTNKQIADVLFLSPRTVERHVANVLRKRGIADRVELRVTD